METVPPPVSRPPHKIAPRRSLSLVRNRQSAKRCLSEDSAPAANSAVPKSELKLSDYVIRDEFISISDSRIWDLSPTSGVLHPATGAKTRLSQKSITFTASAIRAPQTRPAFHPHEQRNAFRCRDVRQQSRSFARWNQSLRCSPNSNRLC